MRHVLADRGKSTSIAVVRWIKPPRFIKGRVSCPFLYGNGKNILNKQLFLFYDVFMCYILKCNSCFGKLLFFG